VSRRHFAFLGARFLSGFNPAINISALEIPSPPNPQYGQFAAMNEIAQSRVREAGFSGGAFSAD
jgi:hypothetical protein